LSSSSSLGPAADNGKTDNEPVTAPPFAAPPPPVEVIPLRPVPPGGAAYIMEIPGKDLLGQRQTVNRNLTDDERTWHFRSAWNVAALNCLGPRYEPILQGYSAYLQNNERDLRRVNERIDAEYRKEFRDRREAIMARETQMTSVYNFFALPPARASFCQTALDISNRALATTDMDAAGFAAANFALFEQPFDTFFTEYETYQRESAAWDAQYGERYGQSQPGYVAVQEARAARAPVITLDGVGATLSTPAAEQTRVIDPDTGAPIPVVPVDETRTSQPIVQPIPNDAGEDDTPQGTVQSTGTAN
jgi:hypothetical protein